jgi:hypothetical protein
MEFIWDQSILPFVCQPAENSDITHLVPFWLNTPPIAHTDRRLMN